MLFAVLWLLAVLPASAAGTGGAGSGIFEWRPFLAPFHSVVLHFPIGFLTLGFLLEVYYWWRPSPEVRRVVTLVLVLSVVSAAVAAGLGWLRAGSGDYDEKSLTMHRWSGTAVVVLAALAMALQWAATRVRWQKVLNGAYRLVLTGSVGLLAYAGHQGGNLTHGSKYLVKNAPEFVRSLIEDEPDDVTSPATWVDEKDRFFAEKIQPIFEQKCRECHSAEKQKGGFRLDEREAALRGGKSGEPAIKPGDPMHSRLVQLITLPPQDDDIMPPEGKATLSPQEIVDLIHWIRNGAHFPEKAAPPPTVVDTPPAPAGGTNAAVTPAPASAPAPVAPAPKPPPVVETIPQHPGDLTYAQDIQPIFHRHCVVCHGPEKQKRGLRLDSLAAALKGARGGETVIVPGHAAQSLVYQRVTISDSADPSDEHMPPAHKELPLTTIEIAAIGRWIDTGAH